MSVHSISHTQRCGTASPYEHGQWRSAAACPCVAKSSACTAIQAPGARIGVRNHSRLQNMRRRPWRSEERRPTRARSKNPVSAQLEPRSYMDASFQADFAMLRCVRQPVRALGSVWCHMLKRLAYACKLELARWRVAFQMRAPPAWTSASTHSGRGAS
eukprot:988970-Pleurochrysis_carterae.AAC.1